MHSMIMYHILCIVWNKRPFYLHGFMYFFAKLFDKQKTDMYHKLMCKWTYQQTGIDRWVIGENCFVKIENTDPA